MNYSMSPDGVMDRLQMIPFVGTKRSPVRGGLTGGDVETINKLYDQDLKISRDECTNQYRFDETSGLCFIKPTNGQ